MLLSQLDKQFSAKENIKRKIEGLEQQIIHSQKTDKQKLWESEEMIKQLIM